MKKKKLNLSSLTSVIYPVLFGVLIVVLWQNEVLNRLFNTTTLILPLPSTIFTVIGDNTAAIWADTSSTLSVILPGLIIGSILGYLLAVAATNSPRFGGTGLTIVAAISAIPTVALASVVLQWTRDVSKDVSVRSYVMKLIIVTIVAIASMTLNAYRGLTELQPFALDLMKSYAADKKEIFKSLRFPNSVPYIFTSLKVSVPACVTAALVSEYFAEEVKGVGRRIRECILQAQYSTAWAYIVIACLIGIILFAITMTAEKVVMRKRMS